MFVEFKQLRERLRFQKLKKSLCHFFFVSLQKSFAMNTQIFEQIRQLKRQIMPNEKLILFGSQARGDANEDSDWDLLVLLNKPKSERDDYDNYGWPFTEIGMPYGTYISPKIYTVAEWERQKPSLFYKFVEQDGIEIV